MLTQTCSQLYKLSNDIYVYIFSINTQSVILFPPKHTAKVYSNLKTKISREQSQIWKNCKSLVFQNQYTIVCTSLLLGLRLTILA